MIEVCFGLHDADGRYSKFTGTTLTSIFENTCAEVTADDWRDFEIVGLSSGGQENSLHFERQEGSLRLQARYFLQRRTRRINRLAARG